jgi:hypothetical protein
MEGRARQMVAGGANAADGYGMVQRGRGNGRGNAAADHRSGDSECDG